LNLEPAQELVTVGIDIGSATSQLSISRIEATLIHDKFVITERELVYESDIILTPFIIGEKIDPDKLQEFFDDQYAAAGILKADVDAGAVLLTGVALQKENARAIADLFAQQAGNFVTVSAGDRMEARLACKGAGIESISRRYGQNIIHIDIGGGTSKFCYVSRDGAISTAAIDVGSRMIVFDERRAIRRIEETGAKVCTRLGLSLHEGDQLETGAYLAIVEYAAEQILGNAGLLTEQVCDQYLQRTPPISRPRELERTNTVAFSGGVSEYLYGREERNFGDLGQALAASLKQKIDENGISLIRSATGIRATVLGASQYNLQLAGPTFCVSNPGMLPLSNIPVLAPNLRLDDDELDVQTLTKDLNAELKMHEHDWLSAPGAIAIRWRGPTSFGRLDGLATALAAVMARSSARDCSVPLVIVCDRDIAGVLGDCVARHIGADVPVLVIDGIEAQEFDYIDIGQVLSDTQALPVVVKSLLFPVHEDVTPGVWRKS
jgi:ethanolamine utilization protein EutA